MPLMVVFGSHPDRTTSVILQAFFSRFAIGVLAASVSFRIHPALSGAIVGLLISLPGCLRDEILCWNPGNGRDFWCPDGMGCVHVGPLTGFNFDLKPVVHGR